MKLERLSYQPWSVLDFYETGLTRLGALCERTWHDRLEVIAEGASARLWEAGENLHAGELKFVAPEDSGSRNAMTEVFPGCPLTFHLAEALREHPLTLHRLLLASESKTCPPDLATAEKLWCSQYANTERWKMSQPFKPDFHFSLLILVRCDIQAIEQYWSLHRLAVSLRDGQLDEALAREFASCQPATDTPAELAWPRLSPGELARSLRTALEGELTADLERISSRQKHSLRRELDRVDAYFENYENELNTRSQQQRSEATRMRTEDRLRAAKAEHQRRRMDQVSRHEIRVYPHLDALLLLAEPAWKGSLEVTRNHQAKKIDAVFVPRSRRWVHEP